MCTVSTNLAQCLQMMHSVRRLHAYVYTSHIRMRVYMYTRIRTYTYISGLTLPRGVLKGLDFVLLRTTLRDRPKGPSTANHQPPPTANRQQPPTANRQRRPIANCQPMPTASNHQSPTTNRRQPPPTATKSHQPPVANRQPPTANTWCTRGLFWKNCVTEHLSPPPR